MTHCNPTTFEIRRVRYDADGYQFLNIDKVMQAAFTAATKFYKIPQTRTNYNAIRRGLVAQGPTCLLAKVRFDFIVAGKVLVTSSLRASGWSLNQIGHYFGGMDHTSIIHLINKAKNRHYDERLNDAYRYFNFLMSQP